MAAAYGKLEPQIPKLLTPGAAEALATNLYRQVRTTDTPVETVLAGALGDYLNPIAPEVMEFQIRLAVNEASAMEFVPEAFRRKSGN